MRPTSMAVGVALSLVIVATGAPVLAQDAESTGSPPPAPAARTMEVAPGVTAEALAFIEGNEAPAVYRLRLDAGSALDFTGDPSISLALVESGQISIEVDAPLTVYRGGETGSAGEPIAAGDVVDLAVGDHLVVPPIASGQLRNAGSEPASLVIASLLTPDTMP